MAYIDALDLHNADRCLLVKIVPKTITGGSPSYNLYISERQIDSAPAWAPGDSGSTRYAGVIDAWGEFGYVTGAVPTEFRISDGSILCRNDKPFGPYGTWAELLVTYELHGAQIWIGQLLTEIVNGAETNVTAMLFKGVITSLGDMGRRTVELYFADLMATTPIIPEEIVTRVDFSDAPDASIGKPIPIILGDFEEAAGLYGMNAEDVQDAGYSNMVGLPGVITHERLDTSNRGPDFRLCAHHCDNIDADAGVMLLEPEPTVPGRVHPDDWTSYSVTPYTEIQTDWPMRVLLPVLPKDYTSPWGCINVMNLVDGDLGTVGSFSGIDLARLESNSATNMGAIAKLEVRAWVKSGGSGTLTLQLFQGGSGYDTLTNHVLSGSEEIVSHECFATGTTPWPSDGWNLADWKIDASSSTGDSFDVRQVWWVVTYYPNRRPDGPTRKIPHQYGDYTVYTTVPAKAEPWSETEKNSVLLGYVSGKVDDGSGTYTGTPSSLIANGADQIFYLAGEHAGLGASGVELGSAIGNRGNARADIGTYHVLSTYIPDRQQAGRYIQRMCQECRAIPIWNTDGKWGIVVIDGDPTVTYRASHLAYDFVPDRDFYPDTFRTWRTPLEELVSSVAIDFDYSNAMQTFRKTAFITPDGTDNGFGTDDDSARELLAGYAEGRFGSGREFRLQAYDVRNQGVAKALRNFYFDNLWRPRTWIEFQTGLNVTDMNVGHIIRFGVETIQGMRVPNPDASNENWDDYLWYVSEVTRLEQDGDVSRYLVRAFEAIIPDDDADWIAAADDT